MATVIAARVASEGVDQDAAKKWFMGLASVFVGGVFTLVSGIRLLSYINADHAGFGGSGDFFVTALVLGAGTEGANTALKYFGYVKDAKKLDQPSAAALTILPPEITVAPGGSVQFAALSTAGGDVKVRWLLTDVGGGSVDARRRLYGAGRHWHVPGDGSERQGPDADGRRVHQRGVIAAPSGSSTPSSLRGGLLQ
jgi:hypothetical protein